MDSTWSFYLQNVGSIPARRANLTKKDLMWTYFFTFSAVFATDLIYIYFVKSIQQDRPLSAAWWSMVVTFTASVAVINYTADHWALIPALAGAFVGAYVGMMIKKQTDIGSVAESGLRQQS